MKQEKKQDPKFMVFPPVTMRKCQTVKTLLLMRPLTVTTMMTVCLNRSVLLPSSFSEYFILSLISPILIYKLFESVYYF